ncbi:hypothetical protein N0V90_007707 [Kalmusia sp. IMI 367209]|nr:hypothetical protein N0V90_007707 [Kalmusia sp. IMI 367209]
MASAVDIITYVGIPLAVLGVLPTIYTAWKSFLTLRQITRMLYSNGVTAITRSALLSGIVEVEIPRRSIIPLDRGDPKYFGLRDTPSRLKGGTWTLFEWKEMVIGVKSYRLQYHDELTQPQAEIDFEALIAFLLDRGAVPSQAGWADLRSAGLWTPAGTKLLVSPVSEEEVLSVALSDDSDGILSLGLNWKREWDSRGRDSLPPYWVRVNAPKTDTDVLAKLNEIEAAGNTGETTEVEKKGGFLDDDSAASEKVPCGVMVLLDTMTDEEVPAWRTPYNDQAERLERQVKLQQQSRSIMEENRLPPAQRDAARKNRLEREAMDFHNDFRRRMMVQEQKKEAELLEAIQSQKLPIKIVGDANLKLLQKHLNINPAPTLSQLIEQILYGMLQDQAFAQRLSIMLDLWKNWAQSGGMTKSHFLAVKEDRITFALASCVLAVIGGLVSEPTGSVVGDLQECLRMWKKVRLG